MPTVPRSARSRAHHPDSSTCYGCVPHLSGGLGVRILGPQSVELLVTSQHQGTPGTAHGGILAALFDEAIGITVWSLGRAYATARLEIDYLQPVPVGTTVRVDTHLTGVRGRKVYAEAEARIVEGAGMAGDVVAARAAALYVEIR